MSTNQKNSEEEVDLGSLFVIIGNGFSRFFRFIGGIFKGIFNFIIIILIFLKQHFIKIGIASILGIALGFFLEVNKPKTYGSNLLVKPNFKSTRQLYDNINYYQDLVEQKDTLGLAEVFNLDTKTASSLKKFEIKPVANDNDIIDLFNEFIFELDTTAVKSFTFKDFKTSFSNYDYKMHQITVTSEKNNIFESLDDVIISSVVKNNYFNRLKVLTNENLNRTDSLLRQNLTQVDSLRKVYMQVMVDEAKKQSNGTNIDLGGEKTTTKELELFETNRRINRDLEEIVADKSEKFETINIVSNFQPIGYEITGITKNYIFIMGLVFPGLMVLFLLLKQLNSYLDNYKK